MEDRKRQAEWLGTDLGTSSGRPSTNAGPLPLRIRLDDKYDVQRILGRGSMGIVYVGRDVRLERDVAIKVLAPRYAADPRVARRFRREAIAMASVRAENVVQIFSFGDYERYPYFVMEYIHGYTVASLIENAVSRGEQLYLDVVLGILRQVCRGLNTVHECGIVHRDVKPPNMLIGPHFKVSITDFGLVETLDESSSSRDLAGTPLYLAPELIRREAVPDHLRQMTDIYALGVSTHEMLTGEVPFDGDSIKEILQRHLTDDPPAVSDFRSDLPTAVDDVLRKALAKRPEARFGSCIEFIEALESARHGQSGKTPRTGSTRLLIADDDAEIRTMYSAALKVGFPNALIHSVPDGLKAIEMARVWKPDLILVDMQMPEMNGLELCAALRGDDLTATIPLVVVTATEDSTVRGVLRDLGITEFLRKPVELTDLVSLVRAHFRDVER